MEVYNYPIPGSIRRYTRFMRLGMNELPTFINNSGSKSFR